MLIYGKMKNPEPMPFRTGSGSGYNCRSCLISRLGGRFSRLHLTPPIQRGSDLARGISFFRSRAVSADANVQKETRPPFDERVNARSVLGVRNGWAKIGISPIPIVLREHRLPAFAQRWEVTQTSPHPFLHLRDSLRSGTRVQQIKQQLPRVD